ncbi:hypothetical protein OROMI_011048 [Orobanche minor]
MKPPTYHEVRVPLLKDEVDDTTKMLKENEAGWKTYGCSIMRDGWEDRKHRTLITLLVNTPQDVEKIGPSNVAQVVVTDSASNKKLAGRLLEARYLHLFWRPCAAHCLDLMLEDIFNIPILKTMFGIYR